ncbi:MAG: hypothetical protein HFE28_00645 [Clostridia bacterium]|jgi:hypothetical protein|nr:hypothetical protein [Clostridia bacterium]
MAKALLIDVLMKSDLFDLQEKLEKEDEFGYLQQQKGYEKQIDEADFTDEQRKLIRYYAHAIVMWDEQVLIELLKAALHFGMQFGMEFQSNLER